MAVIGFMNTLVIEGHKNDIRINALAPTAATRMTEDLMPAEILAMLKPEAVTAGALTLCHKDAPNKFILAAGAGGYAKAGIFETEGIFLPEADQDTDRIDALRTKISDTTGQVDLQNGTKQGEKFLGKAMAFINSQK
jgi:hypothetical protein